MCRLIAYIGNPILLEEVLIKPRNSLIRQSIRAREAEETLNGDGFGLGWYMPEINPIPGVFTSTQPAWNDHNLAQIAAKIRSNCFFAHVRAASFGGVSQFNCHPFQKGRLLFMHNGRIGGFLTIKRSLRRKFSDKTYNWIKGQTDSEHLFGLFLEHFRKRHAHFTVEDLGLVIEDTLADLKSIQEQHDIKEPSFLNLVISSGHNIIATRYLSNPGKQKKRARTLYYARAAELRTVDGVVHMPEDKNYCGAVLVVSEKLDNHKAKWHSVPENHILQIRDDMSVSVQEIQLTNHKQP